jgi:hypothetical protein
VALQRRPKKHGASARIAGPKSVPTTRSADSRVYARSRLSNGTLLLPNVDGRSPIARRYRDIATAIAADQAGASCSEARKQLIRRFAAAAVLAEQLEARLANGEQINISEHALLVSSMVRISRQIGVNRIAKDITPAPDLRTYLLRGAQREAAE